MCQLLWKIAESSGGGNQAGNADRVSSNVAKEPLRVALTAPSSHICQICYVYFSKLVHVYVKVASCICQIFGKEPLRVASTVPSSHMYIFVKVAKCICQSCGKRDSQMGITAPSSRRPSVVITHSSTQISLARFVEYPLESVCTGFYHNQNEVVL